MNNIDKNMLKALLIVLLFLTISIGTLNTTAYADTTGGPPVQYVLPENKTDNVKIIIGFGPETYKNYCGTATCKAFARNKKGYYTEVKLTQMTAIAEALAKHTTVYEVSQTDFNSDLVLLVGINGNGAIASYVYFAKAFQASKALDFRETKVGKRISDALQIPIFIICCGFILLQIGKVVWLLSKWISGDVNSSNPFQHGKNPIDSIMQSQGWQCIIAIIIAYLIASGIMYDIYVTVVTFLSNPFVIFN